MENFITAYSFVDARKVVFNGDEIFTNEGDRNFSDNITVLYKHLKVDYPKFFKMDNLSKLGFLASEILLQDTNQLLTNEPEGIGLVLSNSASSLDTDLKFNELIMDDANYFPSPAVFVYTLPNIVAGEISIRNKIKGENAFFVFDEFNPEFLNNYVNSLLNKEKARGCIAGWINILGEDYESFLIFVEGKEPGLQSADEVRFTIENLKDIYQNLHGKNY